ncbi:MAG: carbohydrate ABC transporter permease [Ruminococcaceae bacterium]|nr:carbohydrate ABC transporter permease [Oscillospiraceae bacterium]
MNNEQTTPKVKRETKNSIKVDFERTPLLERLKAKFGTTFFLTKVIYYIFRLVLLLGISYVILYPFFAKIAGSFMGMEDFIDVTVLLIPKHWTLDTYKAIFVENEYMTAFANTLLLSLSTAVAQTIVCALVGYGLAKFKFKGNAAIMFAVIISMIVPHGTIQLSMYMQFRYFDVLEIFNLLSQIGVVDKPYITNLTNTYWPLILLSITGLAFKNGLYIFMMRQFYRGVPDELEESAYIDGSGTFRTFWQIIVPLSIPMMVTIFLFAFCWQWTDNFYTEVFFTNNKTILMPDIVDIPPSLVTTYQGQNLFYAAIYNTCGIMIIAPLVILYLFCQNFLVQGIERSGLVG